MSRPDKPPTVPPSERRAHPRVPFEVEVAFEVDGVRRTGTTGSLSAGGLSITTGKPPPVGSDVTLELRIPGDDELHRIVGRVRWAGPGETRDDGAVKPGVYAFGVQWHELPSRTLHRIVDLIGSR